MLPPTQASERALFVLRRLRGELLGDTTGVMSALVYAYSLAVAKVGAGALLMLPGLRKGLDAISIDRGPTHVQYICWYPTIAATVESDLGGKFYSDALVCGH